MNEKIMLEMLTQDSVNVKKQNYAIINGVEYPIGEPWHRAYVNNIQGRTEVQEEIPEPYRSVIILMWGDAPTVEQ